MTEERIALREGNVALEARRLPQEELFHDVADRMPSFGGFYLDAGGSLVVWTTDGSMGDMVKSEVIRVLNQRHPHAAFPVGTVRAGEYEFRELALWRDAIVDPALQIDGVVFVDLDEKRNRILVGLSDSTVDDAVRDEIDRLGISREAVVFEIAYPIRKAAADRAVRNVSRPMLAPFDLESVFDTLVGGIEIEWRLGASSNVCTLGFVIGFPGFRKFVTNSHCSEDYWHLDGAAYRQPEGGYSVGTETNDPEAPGCGFPFGWINACRSSDANWISVPAGVAAQVGRIARPQEEAAWPDFGGSTLVDQNNPYFEIAGPENQPVVQNMLVSKVGIATGWTTGRVTQTCITVNGETSYDKVLCQHQVEAGAGPGDSGSPVFFIRPDGTVYLQGLLWGRVDGGPGYVFSPMNGITADLGSMYFWSVTPTPAFDISGPGTLDPGQYGTWSVVDLEGGQPPYTYRWYKDQVLQSGATTASFTTYFSGGTDHFIKAVVTDDLGMSDSRVKQVWVTTCPVGQETCD